MLYMQGKNTDCKNSLNHIFTNCYFHKVGTHIWKLELLLVPKKPYRFLLVGATVKGNHLLSILEV